MPFVTSFMLLMPRYDVTKQITFCFNPSMFFSSVPPRIVMHPIGGTVKIAEAIVLDCVAEGDPTPHIIWMKNDKLVAFNNRVQQTQNESLIIYSAMVSTNFGLRWGGIFTQSPETI